MASKTNQARFKIFCVAGTRPELIKMAPVYKELLSAAKLNPVLDIKWVASGQHSQLVESLYEFFEIKPDFSFHLAGHNNNLATLASEILNEADQLIKSEKPDLIIVQGDTMTVQQFALAAYYNKVQVAHVEAGLRTNDIYSPYPEELARRILAQIASLHFAPTKQAYQNLQNENVAGAVQQVGNTGIDSLMLTLDKINNSKFNWSKDKYASLFAQEVEMDLCESLLDHLDESKKLVLITSHRRETSRQAQTQLLNAVFKLASENPDLFFVFSVHKNPAAREAFEDLNSAIAELPARNIVLLEAISYPMFLKLMQESYMIITDSGGIQEEAPYLQKPVLVFREKTERQEVIDAGLASLLSFGEDEIYNSVKELLDTAKYSKMQDPKFSAYGNANAAKLIVDSVLKSLLAKSAS